MPHRRLSACIICGGALPPKSFKLCGARCCQNAWRVLARKRREARYVPIAKPSSFKIRGQGEHAPPPEVDPGREERIVHMAARAAQGLPVKGR